ncbi:riboflavin kinase [Mycena metata]|uniref:Riboflavin kinase n=1 Tax=Mycena metata TaxID=1033252 RepID=A0AAD7JWU9_9AGAR|nr:riboflavin kinase [Mycena metata]
MAATARSLIIGPSTGPETPYPLQMEGKCIPTANLPVDDNLTPAGVYFGWASHPNHPETHYGFSIYPMVMSIGNNPYYNNTVRSAEAHLLHDFGADFYGVEMRLLITGFIREEKNYAHVEALIEDINVDCDVARKSLDREAWALRETGTGTLDGSWLLRETPEQNRLTNTSSPRMTETQTVTRIG